MADIPLIEGAMKSLLTITAIVEAATGLGLVVLPSVVVQLLLGSPLHAPAAVMLGRWPEPRCSRSGSHAGLRALTRKAARREDW